MILYNVTVKVDHSIHDQWLIWMKQEHIPDVLGTGSFTEARFWKLLDVDETEGATYAVQYTAASKEDYQRYLDVYAAEMRKKGAEKWGDRFIAFRTVMEKVY
jgi:hypothetical protein